MVSAIFCPALTSSCLSARCTSELPTNANGSFRPTVPSSSVALPRLQAVPFSLACSVETPEMAVADPSLKFANLMWFRGSYNAQVFVGEDEPADSVVRRFRKAVMQAGVIPECRRRRFFETPQDIVKRKQQAARRRKTRRFTPRTDGFNGEKKEGGGSGSNDDDDFWGYAEEGADANL